MSEASSVLVSPDVVRDAERFRALLGCQRVAPLGWAGYGDGGNGRPPDATGYRHLVLQLWTLIGEKGANNDTERQTSTRLLCEFADQAIALKKAASAAGTEVKGDV